MSPIVSQSSNQDNGLKVNELLQDLKGLWSEPTKASRMELPIMEQGMLESTLRSIQVELEREFDYEMVTQFLGKLRKEVTEGILRDGLWADELEMNISLDNLLDLYGSSEKLQSISNEAVPCQAERTQIIPPEITKSKRKQSKASPVSPPTTPMELQPKPRRRFKNPFSRRTTKSVPSSPQLEKVPCSQAPVPKFYSSINFDRGQ